MSTSAVATPSTCSACPYFEQFQGEQRGYCHRQAVDKVVKPHHPRTPSCDLPDDDYKSAQAELNQLIEDQAEQVAPETSAEPVLADKAAALTFQRFGNELMVTNSANRSYPMALNGKCAAVLGIATMDAATTATNSSAVS